MSTETSTHVTLTFERFFAWLQEHANCLIRVGSNDTFLYDDELFHWGFERDEDGTPVVQLVFGKNLVGEMVLDVTDDMFVRGAADVENVERGYHLFEVIGGSKAEPVPLYHFLVAHGLDKPTGHEQFKH